MRQVPILVVYTIVSAMLGNFSFAAEPAILTGTVTHVRDGDTIEVGKVPIRLNGVSAPELKEPLGKASKKFMRDLVLGKPVRCELNGKKTYDRLVGTCYLGDIDIGVAVIKAGLALDCPRYSGGRYRAAETVAGRDRIKLPKYCRK
jgi:micrococcal nuclease